MRGKTLLGLVLIGLALSSCTQPPGRSPYGPSRLGPEELQEARSQLQQLERRLEAGELVEAEELALGILDRYPGLPEEDRVLYLGARAARERGNDGLAGRLLSALVRDHPDSPLAPPGAWDLARLHRAAGDREEETRVLLRLYPRLPETHEFRLPLGRRLRELIDEELDLEELDRLGEDFADSFAGSSLAWAAVQKAAEQERPAEERGRRLEAFLRLYPDSRHTDAARAQLAGLVRAGRYRSPIDVELARTDRVGLLCPLSGEYAALGQAMYDGALLALEEYNRAEGDSLTLVTLDTRGDEVVAVQAARQLIEEEGAIAIIGALLSSTTTAVGVLCQERGVPLISPTATKETINQLGPNVFQTNLTRDFETRLVARAGVEALLRRRFAILYPEGEEGRATADLFAAEVEARGGRVVAVETLRRGQTDYAEPIGRIRRAGPEALFVPVAPSEMRLLAPQLVFHDLRVQLLGPSSWNSSSLVREAGESLDRAIVPSDLALVSESDREHFERQWRRRFTDRAASPFAMKTYFALWRVIDSLDPEGNDTRERLRAAIESGLFAGDGAYEFRGGLEKLRVIVDEEIEAFPVAAFPQLTPPPAPSFEELEKLEDEGTGQP